MCKRPNDAVPQQQQQEQTTDSPPLVLRSLLDTVQHCTATLLTPPTPPPSEDLSPALLPSDTLPLPLPLEEGFRKRRRQTKRRHRYDSGAEDSNDDEDEDYVDVELDEPSPISTATLPRRDSRSPRRRRSSWGSSDASAGDSPQHLKSTVCHNYHDYSSYYDPLDATRFLWNTGEGNAPTVCQLDPAMGKVRGGVSSAFPTILHQLLEHALDEGFQDIVSWQPHGRSFHVHNPDLFVQSIMPRYFRQTRYVQETERTSCSSLQTVSHCFLVLQTGTHRSSDSSACMDFCV